jgi:hypothetical protein
MNTHTVVYWQHVPTPDEMMRHALREFLSFFRGVAWALGLEIGAALLIGAAWWAVWAAWRVCR